MWVEIESFPGGKHLLLPGDSLSVDIVFASLIMLDEPNLILFTFAHNSSHFGPEFPEPPNPPCAILTSFDFLRLS